MILTKERDKKMKRFFTLFMAVIMSAFLLAGCGSDSDQTDQATITELQATVDDLKNQVEEYSALKTELDSANNSIAELQSELDALKTEKEEMSAKLEMLYKTEPLDETMYAVSDGDIYDDLYGVALGEEPAGTISAEQEIKITGKSAVIDWYEIEMDGKKQYVSASLVSRDKPQPQQSKPSSNTGTGGGSSQQPSGGNGGGQPSGGNGGSGGGGGQPSGGGDGTGVGGGALSGIPEMGGGGAGGNGQATGGWTVTGE